METISNFEDLVERAWREGEHARALAEGRKDGMVRHDSSTGILINGGDDVEEVLYQNLIDTVPLVESMMTICTDAAGSARQSLQTISSVCFSCLGSRPGKRLVSEEGRIGHSLMDPWDEDEISRNCRESYLEETQMLSGHRASEDFASEGELFQLHSQIEELERKLQERDTRLLSSSVKTDKLRKLRAEVDRIHAEIFKKDGEIHSTRTQLSAKQNELSNLCALLQEVEADVGKSLKKAAKAEQEVKELRRQIAALHFKIDAIDAAYEVDSFNGSTSAEFNSLTVHLKEKKNFSSQNCVEEKDVERAKQMYLASRIVATRCPSEETFTMLVEFRSQLYSYSTWQTFSCPSDKAIFRTTN